MTVKVAWKKHTEDIYNYMTGTKTRTWSKSVNIFRNNYLKLLADLRHEFHSSSNYDVLTIQHSNGVTIIPSKM